MTAPSQPFSLWPLRLTGTVRSTTRALFFNGEKVGRGVPAEPRSGTRGRNENGCAPDAPTLHRPSGGYPLLAVRDLQVHFGSPANPIRAVDGVDFDIRESETVALVGESGCGKSVTAMALARLLPAPPARYVAGRIRYRSMDVLAMGDKQLRTLRGSEIAYIFQDPANALNPVFRIGDQIGEVIRLHRRRTDPRVETVALLRMVGMADPERTARAYPHQLSGGMQQRAMIALALAGQPRLLVADEPTTALDVTIQAQILELLQKLQRDLGMAMLWITHNLGLVAGMAHRVNVMYAGRLVESGPTREVLTHPRHPYTCGLLHAVPQLSGHGERLSGIDGVVPPPTRIPAGCRFHPRCPLARALCRTEEPELQTVSTTRGSRCHFWQEVDK